MKLQHPYYWLTEPAQRQLFKALLVLTALVMAAMALLDRPLKTPAAPFGIVSFELAGNQSNAQKMLQSWQPPAKTYAALSLGLDYLFLVAYASTISLACVLVAKRLEKQSNRFSSIGILLAWSLPAAAMLDAIENYALIRILLGAKQELWPTLALFCAIPKFAIVAAGLAYLILGGVKISKNNRMAKQ